MKDPEKLAGRASLYALIIDEEVAAISKKRLTAEQRADLILEDLNPYRPLTSAQRASLAGVSESALNKRKYGKRATHYPGGGAKAQ